MAVDKAAPVGGRAGRSPYNGRVGVGVRRLDKVRPLGRKGVVQRTAAGHGGGLKAAVLQLDVVGHPGLGGRCGAACAGDLHLIVKPVRIADARHAGIECRVEPLLTACLDVPARAGADLRGHGLPVGPVPAAVPCVDSPGQLFITAVDLRGQAAVGGNAVDEHHPGHGGRPGGHLRQGTQHRGACCLGRGRLLRCGGRGFGRCRRGHRGLCGCGGRCLAWRGGRLCGWFRRWFRGWLWDWLCRWLRGRLWGWLCRWLRGRLRGRFCRWLRGWLRRWLRGGGLGRCRVRRGLGGRRCGQGRLLLRKDCAGHARRHTAGQKHSQQTLFHRRIPPLHKFLRGRLGHCRDRLGVYRPARAEGVDGGNASKPYAPRPISTQCAGRRPRSRPVRGSLGCQTSWRNGTAPRP